jgi:hypothetical protein
VITLRQPAIGDYDQAYVAARSDDASQPQSLNLCPAEAEVTEDFGFGTTVRTPHAAPAF